MVLSILKAFGNTPFSIHLVMVFGATERIFPASDALKNFIVSVPVKYLSTMESINAQLSLVNNGKLSIFGKDCQPC